MFVKGIPNKNTLLPTVTKPSCVLTRKPKPFTVGFLYRPLDKIDLVNCIDQFCGQFNTLETQCYLLGDFNTNLFFKSKEILCNKTTEIAYKEMPSLTKKYLEFWFSYSLERIIPAPTRTTDRTATLIDHVLKNSSHKVNQSGAIDLGFPDHYLIFCTRTTLRPKSHKYSEILVRSMKHYTIKKNLKKHLKNPFSRLLETYLYNCCVFSFYK